MPPSEERELGDQGSTQGLPTGAIWRGWGMYYDPAGLTLLETAEAAGQALPQIMP